MWNDNEMIPLIVRSALTVHALPNLGTAAQSWLPVDRLARVIVEIAQMRLSTTRTTAVNNNSIADEDDDTVYNISNPNTFPWSTFLTILNKNGFPFSKPTSPESWLTLLRESEHRGEEDTNPAVKLIDHFEGHMPSPPQMIMTRSLRDSATLRRVAEFGILEDGTVDRYVEDWLARWIGVGPNARI